eukprot:866189-Rhodomonas_salina.1
MSSTKALYCAATATRETSGVWPSAGLAALAWALQYCDKGVTLYGFSGGQPVPIPISLRACYGMSGTELTYRATRRGRGTTGSARRSTPGVRRK